MPKLTPDKLRKIVRDIVTQSCNFDSVVKCLHGFDHQYESTGDSITPLQSMEADQRLTDRPLGHGVRVGHARHGRANIPVIREECIAPCPGSEKPAYKHLYLY